MDSESAVMVAAAMGEDGDLVELRLARGCRCFAILLGDALGAYGWVSTGAEWIGELGLEIRLPAGEAYVWNCFTLPPHRRRGLFRTLLLYITHREGQEGISRLWIGTVDGVGDSAAAYARFAPVLSLTVADVGGFQWLSAKRAPGAAAATTDDALKALSGRKGGLQSGPRRRGRHRH